MVLTEREKLLVGLLAAVLLLSGVFLGVRFINTREQGMVETLASRESVLRRAQALQAELALQPAKTSGGGGSRSLISYVEQLATRSQVKDRIQLNLLSAGTAGGGEGLDVKVDNLTLDELTNLVYVLENADYGLAIDQMEITPSFRDKDLLRVTMRVLARE